MSQRISMRGNMLGLAFGAGVFLAACAPTQDSASNADTLYSRLGGQPAIEAVVGRTLTIVAADNRINDRFAGSDLEQLNQSLVDQICEATGGPCKYTGPDMVTAHAGLNLTDAEFDAFAEDIVAAMNDLDVPAEEQSELMGLLGGMRADVVGA